MKKWLLFAFTLCFLQASCTETVPALNNSGPTTTSIGLHIAKGVAASLATMYAGLFAHEVGHALAVKFFQPDLHPTIHMNIRTWAGKEARELFNTNNVSFHAGHPIAHTTNLYNLNSANERNKCHQWENTHPFQFACVFLAGPCTQLLFAYLILAAKAFKDIYQKTDNASVAFSSCFTAGLFPFQNILRTPGLSSEQLLSDLIFVSSQLFMMYWATLSAFFPTLESADGTIVWKLLAGEKNVPTISTTQNRLLLGLIAAPIILKATQTYFAYTKNAS